MKKFFRRALVCLLVTTLLVTPFSSHVSATARTADELDIGEHIRFGSFDGIDLVWEVVHLENGLATLYCATPFLEGEFDASVHKYTITGMTSQYRYGSSSWRTSDLRAFLNSSGETVAYDTEGFDYSNFGSGGQYDDNNNPPSYAAYAGFLNERNFMETEVALIEPTFHRTLVPNTDPEMLHKLYGQLST